MAVKTSRQRSKARASSPASETQPLSAGLPMDAAGLSADFERHLSYTLGRDNLSVNGRYRYTALVMAVRDRLMERWKATHSAYYQADCKRGY
jgi:starch phosphorylase